VLDGSSFTLLSATQAELVDTGLIINVHKSVAEASVYVSCGEVLSATAPPPATPPAATPTAGTGVTAPDTGTGPGADDGISAWALVIFALVTLGAAITFAGAATGHIRRR
jgi:hypothetical protein